MAADSKKRRTTRPNVPGASQTYPARSKAMQLQASTAPVRREPPILSPRLVGR